MYEMLFLLFCALSVPSFVNGNDSIFRGVEDLDQEVDEDILPGGDVSFGAYPYVAAVFNAMRKFHTCTGAIIHRSVVLTAGYCVLEDEKIVDPVHVSVLGGVVDMRDHVYDQWRFAVAISGSETTYKSVKTLVLIKVNSPFFLSYSLKTVTYSRRPYASNSFCTAITWRFRDKLNRLTLKSLVLKQYSVYVLNESLCQSKYSSNPLIHGFDEVGFICMNFVASRDPGSQDYECVIRLLGSDQSTWHCKNRGYEICTSVFVSYMSGARFDHSCCALGAAIHTAGIDGSMIFCKEYGELRPVGAASTFVGGSTCNRVDAVYTFFDLGASFEWITREIPKLLLS